MIIVKAEQKYSQQLLVPVGNHLACCYQIIDLGTQKTEWNGVLKMQHKVMLNFEVHSEDQDGKACVTEDGKPLTISDRYTLTLLDTSKLFKNLQSWRSKPFTPEELRGFNLENVLGKWCMINVVHKPGVKNPEKTYANIESISAVPTIIKKSGYPKQFNPNVIFSLDEFNQSLDEFNQLVFDSLPDWIKEIIKQSPEYRVLNGFEEQKFDQPKKDNQELEDIESDIPF